MPFTMFTFMLDHSIWGGNACGYHLTALLLHAVAVCGLYRCLCFFRVRTIFAVLIAIVFAVHPQRVESVVWLSERKDVLCTALYFWSIYAYLRGGNGLKWGKPVAVVLYILALLSKPMAVSLPFVFMCIELHKRRDFNWKYYLARFLPLLVPAVSIMVVTIFCQVKTEGKIYEIIRQALVVIHNVFWTVWTTFIPYRQLPIYPRIDFTPWLITVMMLFYLLVICVAIRMIKVWSRDRILFDLLPGVMAFLFAMAPVAGFFQLGHADYADRYTYIPSAFLWFGAVWAFQSMISARSVFSEKVKLTVFFILLGYLCWLIVLSVLGTNIWKDYESIISYSCSPEYVNDMALCSQGVNALKANRYNEAMLVAERLKKYNYNWMNEARRRELKIMALYLEGQICYDFKKYPRAYVCFATAYPLFKDTQVRRRGIFETIASKLYELNMMRGKPKEAMICLKSYLMACKGPQKNFKFYFYSGVMAMMQKNYAAAVTAYKKALELQPDDEALRKNYNNALEELKMQKNAKQSK